MAHLLSLEVPPISNPKALRIYDTSQWDAAQPVSGRKLSILPPGYTQSVVFTVAKGFDRLFNASNLGMQVVNTPDELGQLPDGLYVLRLTVENGTDAQWVEYNHLRQVCVLKDYHRALCSLNFYPCDTLDRALEEKRHELGVIKSYIDAAKAKVEWCNAPNEGLELHHYARKLLDKFTLEKCKTC